jgi:hypothetical protein
LGGLDIFMTKGSKKEWQDVENLRAPINGSSDDFYFIKIGDNMRGYFSSNRAGGKGGDDIYSFSPSEEIRDAVMLDIPVTADIVDLYIPHISQDDVGQTAIFPPYMLKDMPKRIKLETTPVAIAETERVEVLNPEPEEQNAQNAGEMPSLYEPYKAPDKDKIALICVALDSKTQNLMEDVKLCATHNNTRVSSCKQTNREGWANFELVKNAAYTISAFKAGYILSTPPIHVNSSQVNPDRALPVIIKKSTRAFHDIDSDLKKQQSKKKKKNEIKRGQREYRVHLLAIERTSKLDRSYFEKIKAAYPDMTIKMSRDGKYKRYTYGSFESYREAKNYVARFTKLGYGGKKKREICFVAVFVNGKHIGNIYADGKLQKVKK